MVVVPIALAPQTFWYISSMRERERERELVSALFIKHEDNAEVDEVSAWAWIILDQKKKKPKQPKQWDLEWSRIPHRINWLQKHLQKLCGISSAIHEQKTDQLDNENVEEAFR